MQIELITILLIGFLSSFGHCIGMCGGFVVAYTLRLNTGSNVLSVSFWQSLYPHLLYNLGRIITYAFLGFLFGFLGETMGVILGIKNYQSGIEIFAGIVMILMGLELGGWVPLDYSKFFPGYNLFKNTLNRLIQKVGRNNIFVLGLVLGFIPCGLIYAAGAKAATSGSVLLGILTMAAFGIGTLPAMVLVGMSANLVSVQWRQKLFRIATVLVILLGIMTIYRGVRVLSHPPMMHQSSTQTEYRLSNSS